MRQFRFRAFKIAILSLFLGFLQTAQAENIANIPQISQAEIDSLAACELCEVLVIGDAQQREKKESPLSLEVLTKQDLTKAFSGNLMRSLEKTPGVQSMSVGSGFAKPMIRGMAFNRVSVSENGVKQEGQQWGVDHGVEIDAFNVEKVNILKGPASLLWGSDAMGGVVEILPPSPPSEEGAFGSFDALARSNNGLLGASLMLGAKKGAWFVRARYSEQHFADLAVPTDTVVYLTQKLPLANGRLNNTAGQEKGANLYLRYAKNRLSAALAVSNAYQKVGFFAGAHGIPDASKVVDDGDYRDIDLPYSFVNHFKSSLNLKYFWDSSSLAWDLAYQNNHREEWSAFHSHYNTQTPPAVDPDKELAFMLDTYSSSLKFNFEHTHTLKSSFAWDLQYQNNEIAGYSFLLPSYRRSSSGLAWVSTFRPSSSVTITGGLRYDIAAIESDQYIDSHLEEYLQGVGYDDEFIADYIVRSQAIDRNFGDYSLSLGLSWQVDQKQDMKLNLGRSFRLPGLNELASNGLHHSSFRHEQGDSTLDTERGWQVDAAYSLQGGKFQLSFSPYFSWYQNYIYLSPSGEWSKLPHAGQVYNYTEGEAVFCGAELSARLNLSRSFSIEVDGEYSYTYNMDAQTPLPLSPPARAHSSLVWSKKFVELSLSADFIAAQTRVAKNEETTPGATLFGASAAFALDFLSPGASAVLSLDNIFDTKYLNHLSFYRTIEVPEPGRNLQLSIKLPF